MRVGCSYVRAAAAFGAAVVILASAAPARAQTAPPIWTVPEIGALPDDANGRLVRRGRDLVTATYAHIGPEVADPAKRFAGNNLACGNCHLQAGTKKFGIPLFGLFGLFPLYSARQGGDISIEDRLNACMTRSMNGRALSAGSSEMEALVAYIKFLSTGVPPGQRLPGLGVGRMPELDRAADPVRGRAGYADKCLVCHGTNGDGLRRSLPSDDLGYMMPQLSPEQAWDIAAYVVSQPRPHKANLDKDFPDLLEKPVDAPYGPYADGFSEQQHKYGPFAPIRLEVARLKAEKGTSAPTSPPR